MNNLLLLFFIVFISLSSCGLKTSEDDTVLNDTIVTEDIGFTIPFELINGRMVVSPMLNGVVPVKLAVDNGLNELHLVEKFAQKYGDTLGIELHPNAPAMGTFIITPNQKSYVANGKFHYDFGDSVYVNYNKSAHVVNGEYTQDFAYILEGDEVVKSLPEGVVGIMPLQSFSKNGIFKINFKDKRLEFPETIDSLAVQYKFDDDSRSMDFPIEFVGKSEHKSYVLSSILDLGYYGNVLMFGNKNVNRFMESMSQDYYSDVEPYSDKFRYFRALKMGKDSVFFGDMETLFLKNVNGPSDALIGIGVMSKYDMFFDYANGYIYMKPLKRRHTLKDETYITAGIKIKTVNVDEEERYVITTVLNECKKVDVKLYDTLLKIDDVYLNKRSLDSLDKTNRDKSALRKTVTVKRGDKILVLSRNQ